MRDERGRYISTKEISLNGPEWAAGCDHCECGITSAPELTGMCEIYMERMVQAIESKGAIFCTCRAGMAARSNLLNKRQALIEEARKNPMMLAAAMANTHPDIEVARHKIAETRAEMVPSMHFEGVTA